MEESKSLQKFTHIENLEQLQDHLRKFPKDAKALDEALRDRITDSYTNKLAKEIPLVDMIEECCRVLGEETNIRNTTYEHNHYAITATIHNYVTKERVFPTSKMIAKETGLSRQTVHNHLKEGSFNKHKSIIKDKLEFMATQALTNLYLIGMENKSVSALKAFIELSGASNDQSTVNNYIQINNLKLSKEDFDQLPEKTLSRIEKIIYKELNNQSNL